MIALDAYAASVAILDQQIVAMDTLDTQTTVTLRVNELLADTADDHSRALRLSTLTDKAQTPSCAIACTLEVIRGNYLTLTS